MRRQYEEEETGRRQVALRAGKPKTKREEVHGRLCRTRHQNTEEYTGRRQVAPRTAEPKTKRKGPAVPRDTRTKIIRSKSGNRDKRRTCSKESHTRTATSSFAAH
jgi:hypothetical protein